MATKVEDILEQLSQKIAATSQSCSEMARIDQEIKDFVLSLEPADILSTIKVLKKQMAESKAEIKSREATRLWLRNQITAIQDNCPHENEDVYSKNGFESRFCKNCSALRYI